jgi:hypothetical protein
MMKKEEFHLFEKSSITESVSTTTVCLRFSSCEWLLLFFFPSEKEVFFSENFCKRKNLIFSIEIFFLSPFDNLLTLLI